MTDLPTTAPTVYYAAHDTFSVYGCGLTPEDALADARDASGDGVAIAAETRADVDYSGATIDVLHIADDPV
jgi:hypothetical protein